MSLVSWYVIYLTETHENTHTYKSHTHRSRYISYTPGNMIDHDCSIKGWPQMLSTQYIYVLGRICGACGASSVFILS